MEARLARLESHVEHIHSDVQDIKVDLRDMRGDVRDLRGDMRTDFRVVVGIIITITIAILGAMSRGFGWL